MDEPGSGTGEDRNPAASCACHQIPCPASALRDQMQRERMAGAAVAAERERRIAELEARERAVRLERALDADPAEFFGHLRDVVDEAASRDHDRSMQIGGLRDRIAELEGAARQAYLAIAFKYGGCSEEQAKTPEDRAMIAAMGALHIVLGLVYAEALKQRQATEAERLRARVAELEAMLRRVLDNTLIAGRGGVITPDDYNAARAVLDGVPSEPAGASEGGGR